MSMIGFYTKRRGARTRNIDAVHRCLIGDSCGCVACRIVANNQLRTSTVTNGYIEATHELRIQAQ